MMRHKGTCLGVMIAAWVSLSATAVPAPISGMPPTPPPPRGDLAPLVARLVDDTARDSDSERRAFNELMNLGSAGVPYIVSHLGDGRRLPEQSIWVSRNGMRDRQGQPWYVHDGLEFVLKVVTGYAFGPQNGHLLESQRMRNKRKWVGWCVGHYPAQADICRSGS